jgi:ribosomal protein S18 acetylase RimI-like enzyme
VTAEIKSCPVETARTFCASRESAAARRLYGAPFVTAPSSHALAATDQAAASVVGALVYTLCGGVAEIESVAVDPNHPDVGDALVRRFEEAASYNNCHKLIARVKQAGAEQEWLERLRFRVTAVLERHFFQADFVDMVKWIA